MKDRVCVVTGATTGIGKETARELARAGARVLLLARNAERAEAARAELAAETGATVEVVLADLSSLTDVRRAAREIEARAPRLDVLVNNAGVLLGRREVTSDGYEKTFATNHLAYFLLAHELGGLLRRSAPARIVNVASVAHVYGRMYWDDLMLEREYSELRAYGQSKLANILFTRELARRLAGTGVTANCLHPGGVWSPLYDDVTSWTRLAMTIARPFLIGPKKGARTSVYLATSPEVAEVTGEYFVRCRPRRPAKHARDDDAARRLWDASAKLCGVAT